MHTEPYTEARYSIHDLSLSTTPESSEKLHLPAPNRYLSSNFEIKQTIESKWEHPQKVQENENGELWFKGDSKFNLPRGKAVFHFRHENPSGLLHIYNKLFTLKLAKFVYEAEVTGLYYTIDGDFRPGSSNFETWQNLRISVQGLNEKLNVLLNEILDQINSFQAKGLFLADFF